MREGRLVGATVIAMVLLVAVCATFASLVRNAQAVEFAPKSSYAFEAHPSDVTNQRVLEEMQFDELRKLHDKLARKREAEQAPPEAEQLAEGQATWEAEQATYHTQSYVDDSAYYDDGTYYAEYSDLYNTNGPSRYMPGWYDGYLETYYDASRHYLASEWTVDSEGFYHDANGRYVVGVDINDVNPDTGQQYQYGDVVDTGKGEGVVYDYGQGAHVHDFAVAGVPSN